MEGSVTMSLEPLHPGIRGLPTNLVEGAVRYSTPSMKWFEEYLSQAKVIQDESRSIGFRRRVRILEELGKAWVEKLESCSLEGLKMELTRNTGYGRAMIEKDLRFVVEVFKKENIEALMNAGLQGGWRSLDDFVEVELGEYVSNFPAGPVLIIASGNSVIPPLIAAVTSLATGNLTILRPSLTNYKVVREVFKPLEDLAEAGGDGSVVGRALLVTYLAHDSEVLEYLLKSAPIGVVNYWGGEPGRTRVYRAVMENPYRPRLYVNGPLTGVAVVDGDSVSDELSEALAREVLMYDQQLCSSPTISFLIGDYERAMGLAKEVGNRLDIHGALYKLEVSEGWMFGLTTLRKALELHGAKVIRSRDHENPYTIVISKGKSSFVGLKLIPLNIHLRRRFLEIVSVPDIKECVKIIRELPKIPGYTGIDGVQTVALWVKDGWRRREYIRELIKAGVYRVVPLGESYIRTPFEPYDGEFMPRYFTYTVYFREKLLSEG